MKKVLATSQGGRTLVAFGWVNVRICDRAGVKAATVTSLDLQREIKADPDLMDFVDLNYYGKDSPEVDGSRKRRHSPCHFCGSYDPPISGDAVHKGYDGYPVCPRCKAC